MKSIILSLTTVTLLAMQAGAEPTAQPAAPPAKAAQSTQSSKLAKVKYYTKKGLMLPVYIVGGAVAGGFVWYHFGGNEQALKALLRTMP
jgi:hypothetical protein